MPYLDKSGTSNPSDKSRKIVLSLDSGFRLNDGLPFFLKETGFQVDIRDRGNDISLAGSDKTTLLGNEGDTYTISTLDRGRGGKMTQIMYDLMGTSNRILMASLQEYPAADNRLWGSNEAGTEGNYLTTMASLKNISLNGATMQTFIGSMPEYK